MAYLGSVASVANKGGTQTQALTASQTIAAGTVLFMIIGVDNTDATNPTTSISTAGGGTWTLRGTVSSGVSATNGSGVFGYLYSVTTTSSVTSGTTLSTITFSAAAGPTYPTSRAVQVIAFDNLVETFRGSAATGSSTSGAPTATHASPLNGDLVIGAIVGEDNSNPTGDADTLNGSWSTIDAIASTGAGAATNVAVGIQYKIVNASGSQTYNATTTNDSGVIVLTVATPIAATMSGQSNTSGSGAIIMNNTATMSGQSITTGSLAATAINTFVLSGQSNSAGGLAAAIKTTATLSGQSNSAGQATAAATIKSTMSGQSTTTGSLAAFNAKIATMSGQSNSSGSGAIVSAIKPTMTGQSNTTGSFAPTIAYKPNITGQSNTTGSLKVGVDSPGTMTATALTYGALAVGQKVTTTISGQSNSSGQATANFSLSSVFIGWGNPI